MSQAADLPTQVRQILHVEWDPIGVSSFPGAQDEYESYVGEVCGLVSARAGKQRIFDYLWRMETEYMGLRGNRPRTEQIAERLANLSAPRDSGTRSDT